jgi:hypothetical protein
MELMQQPQAMEDWFAAKEKEFEDLAED